MDFCDITPLSQCEICPISDLHNEINYKRSESMSISDDQKANILRYHHVEKWRVGTIARHLGVHHTTVKRVLAETGVSNRSILVQGSMIDPYLAFITETLQRFPTLTASRLYDMAKERGYPGSRDHFRHLIAFYRPRKASEAYMRLRTLPGEQAQVDWALCRARHNAHYADYFTMPSLYPEFLISSAIQPKYLGISPDLLGIVFIN
jgi:AraC-like DNA-binding protein